MENRNFSSHKFWLGKKPKGLFVALVVFVFLLAPVFSVKSAASPPQIINYQGKILDSVGVPVVDGIYDIQFAIYDDPSAGNCLWHNSSSDCSAPAGGETVQLTSGLFTVGLGDTAGKASYYTAFAAFPADLFNGDETLYLAVNVESDGWMVPRKQLFSVPFSLNSDRLDGLDGADFLRSNATDTYEGEYNRTLTIESDLTDGNRTAELLKIIQANDTTYSFATDDLVSISQLDIDSGSLNLHLVNAGIGDSFRIDDEVGDTTPIVIDASGNMVIGGTTASAKLHTILGASEKVMIDGATTTHTGIDGLVDINFKTATNEASALNIDLESAGMTTGGLVYGGMVSILPDSTDDGAIIIGNNVRIDPGVASSDFSTNSNTIIGASFLGFGPLAGEIYGNTETIGTAIFYVYHGSSASDGYTAEIVRSSASGHGNMHGVDVNLASETTTALDSGDQIYGYFTTIDNSATNSSNSHSVFGLNVDITNNNYVGNLYGAYLGLDNSGTVNGVMEGLLIRAKAGTMDSYIHLDADTGTADYGIEMTGSTINVADISLTNAETISNLTDNYIVFTGNGSGNDTDITFNLSGTQPVIYSDTDILVQINDNLLVSNTATDGILMSLDQNDVDQTILDFQVANTAGDLINVDWDGGTTQSDNLIGLDIDMTDLTPSNNISHLLAGIYIKQPFSNTSTNEYGLVISGTNWDEAIRVYDHINIASDTGRLQLGAVYNDFEIYHNGTDSYVQTGANGGNLMIVNGSTSSGGDIYLENNVEDEDIIFKVNDGGADVTLMTMDGSASRVGIMTANPGAYLDVSALENTELIRLSDTSNVDSTGLFTGTGDPNIDFVAAQAGSLFLDQAGTVWVNTDGTTTGWSDLGAGGGSLWEQGVDVIYENDDDVVVGDDPLTDTPLTNTGFVLDDLNADDLYVEDLLGVGDKIYVENDVIIGNTLTLSDGSITQSTGDLAINLATLAKVDVDGDLEIGEVGQTWAKLLTHGKSGSYLAFEMGTGTADIDLASDGDHILYVDQGTNTITFNDTGNSIQYDFIVEADGAPVTYAIATDRRTGHTSFGAIYNQVGFGEPVGQVEIHRPDGGSYSALFIDMDSTGSLTDTNALNIQTKQTMSDVIKVGFDSATSQSTSTVTGFHLDFSNFTPDSVGGGDTYGFRLQDPASNTNNDQYGIYINGNNWDAGIYSEDDIHLTQGNHLGFGGTASTPDAYIEDDGDNILFVNDGTANDIIFENNASSYDFIFRANYNSADLDMLHLNPNYQIAGVHYDSVVTMGENDYDKDTALYIFNRTATSNIYDQKGLWVVTEETGAGGSGRTDTTIGLDVDVTRTDSADTVQTDVYGLTVNAVGDTLGSTNEIWGGYFSAIGGDYNYGLVVADGNVGIGTTTPDVLVEISGLEFEEMIRFYDEDNGDYASIYVGNGTPDGSLAATGGSIYLDEEGALYVNTDVGGGTGTDWSKLSTSATTWLSGTYGIYYNGGMVQVGADQNWSFLDELAGDLGVDDDLQVKDDVLIEGVLYVGTASPSPGVVTIDDNDLVVMDDAYFADDIEIEMGGNLYFGRVENYITESVGSMNFYSLNDFNFNLQGGTSDDFDVGLGMFVVSSDVLNGAVAVGTYPSGAKFEIETAVGDGGDTLFIDDNSAANESLYIDSENTTGHVFNINADLVTTGNVIEVTADSLTTGHMLNFTSTSNGLNTATGSELVNFLYDAAAVTDTAMTGEMVMIDFQPNIATAVTSTISGNVLGVYRYVTDTGTANVSGAMVSFRDNAIIDGTHTADVLRVHQDYANNTGAALNITTDTVTGLALRVNDDGTFADTTPFVVDYDGRVGIGTVAPEYLLELQMNALTGAEMSLTNADTSIDATNTLGQIYFRGIDSSVRIGAQISAISVNTWDADTDVAATDLRFYTQDDTTDSSLGTARMTIEDGGDVGIGTESPSGTLHVKGESDSNITAIIQPGATQTGDRLQVTAGDGTAEFVINTDGYIGINDAIPTAQFDLLGAFDVIQMRVIGNATQNSDYFIVTAADGTGLLTVDSTQSVFVGAEGDADHMVTRGDLFVENNLEVDGNIYGPDDANLDFISTNDGFTFALGGGAGDDFVVDTTTFVVESDDKQVGIGTATPRTELDITKSTSGGTILYLENTFDGTVGLQIITNTGVLVASDWAAIRTDTAHQLMLGANNSTNMVLDTDGQVGINKVSGAIPWVANAWLEIEDTEDSELIRLYDSTNADSTGLYTGLGTPDGALNAQAGSLFLDQAGSLYLNTSVGSGTDWSEVNADAASGWTDDGLTVRLTTSTDNVSVGSAIALAKLSVTGDTDEYQFVVRGNSSQTNSLIYADSSAGNKYFGVEGNGLVQIVDGVATINSADGAGDLYVENDLEVDGDIYGSTTGNLDFISTNYGFTFTLGGGASNDFIVDVDTLVVESDNDRVGIGTASPSYTLDVAGTVGIDNFIYHNGDADTSFGFANNEFGVIAGGNIMLKIDEVNNEFWINPTGPVNPTDVRINYDDLFVEGSSGYIGVNTDDPLYQVHLERCGNSPTCSQGPELAFINSDTTVDSNTNLGNLYFGAWDAGLSPAIGGRIQVRALDGWTEKNNAGAEMLFYVESDNTAGLDIGTPRLVISDTLAITGPDESWWDEGGVLSLGNQDTNMVADDILGHIYFKGEDSTWINRNGAFIQAISEGTWSGENDQPTALRFYTQNDTPTNTLTAPRLTIDSDGEVGIGTATADYRLEVVNAGEGEISIKTNETTIVNGDDLGRLLFVGADSGDTTDAIGAFIRAEATAEWGDTAAATDAPTRLAFYTQSDGSGDTLGSARLTIDDVGNVLIGDNTANAKLYVIRSTSGNVFRADDAVSDTSPFVIDGDGNVIIGDTTAEAGVKFEVKTATSFVVTSDGDVGIGTTSPDQELDVEGDIQLDFNGTATTNGVCHSGADSDTTASDRDLVVCSDTPGDIAEWYDTTGTVPGDIVVTTGTTTQYQDKLFDPRTGMQTHEVALVEVAVLGKGSQPYQHGIMGIISTNPVKSFGKSIIDNSPNTNPVALIGRVPTKVTAFNGAIEPGDPITTSMWAGVGMKADKPGWVVGYALDYWSGPGEGMIMVFVDPGWHSGGVITNSGNRTLIDDNVAITPSGTADEIMTGYNSKGLSFVGSAWAGLNAQSVEMTVTNTIIDLDNYKLAIFNDEGFEVASFNQDGDLTLAGKLFPSEAGKAQTENYIFYENNYMRTNASGWGSGAYDLAEMFISNQVLEPGDLVATGQVGEYVEKTDEAYDAKAIGIVSTKPGYLGGLNVQFDDDSPDQGYPIALAGRVPTKVSTENGTIQIGDMITASSVPGVGMKATEPGTVVGRALEVFNGPGKGLITVFINPGWFDGEEMSVFEEIQTSLTLNTLDMNGPIDMHGNPLVEVGEIIGVDEQWAIDANGVLKVLVAKDSEGNSQEVYGMSSTQVEVTISGSSKLENGQAEITLADIDKTFGKIVSTDVPLKIIVTPTSNTTGIFVSDKLINFVDGKLQHTGFKVKELNNGDSNATFDWIVIGRRVGYEELSEEDEAPVVEEPVVEDSVVEDPIIEDSVVEEPIVEESIVEDPVVEEPIVEESIVEDSVVEEPIIE